MRRAVALLVLAAGAIVSAQRPTFEVASVKRNTLDGPVDGMTNYFTEDSALS